LFRSSVITPGCESTEQPLSAVLDSEPPLEAQTALLPLSIPVGLSCWPSRLLCSTSLLLFAALYFSRLSLPLIALLGAVWCLYALLQWRRIKRYAIASVSIDDNAGWHLLSVGECWPATDTWLLEGDYSWHPWLLSVRLRNRSSGRRLQLLLYPDSASCDGLRRLRVLLLTLRW